jgi:cellulose synthase/poly-beta-1,6-N-acetylglucosamine synthase-like glycosyltransferase
MSKNNTSDEEDSEDLPLYSILLPVFMEEKLVLEQLFEAIEQFDYPKNKLQVLLILEAIDKTTINYTKSIKSKLNYEIIIVPDFTPRTKAKACNYALNFVKGDYVVVFDADDIPSSNQLRLAYMKFMEENDSQLVCLQAKLNYYNSNENLLTRLFSLEYAILFDKILPSLSQKNYPLPLGGTSNHFKTLVLKELRGWDIYNLAEDAEIGMRLSFNGYKSKVIDSYTAEESPVTLFAWIKQRSRWFKGFIQTYLLYLQKSHNLSNKIGSKKSFISLHFMLGLSTLSLILTPLMLVLGVSVVLGYIEVSAETNEIIFDLTAASAIFWITSNIYQSVKTFRASKFLKNIPFINKVVTTIVFTPYYILHTVAAIYAVFDLIRRPFYWSKTKHGIAKSKKLLQLD